MSREFKATGQYYVASYDLPIFNVGYVHWSIINPEGKYMLMALGSYIDIGPGHEASVIESRKPVDEVVRLLNLTVTKQAQSDFAAGMRAAAKEELDKS